MRGRRITKKRLEKEGKELRKGPAKKTGKSRGGPGRRGEARRKGQKRDVAG